MFDNFNLNGDWLQMQALVHELNKMYLPMPTPNAQMEKRGSIPFLTSHDFLMPSSFNDMTYY